MPEITARKDSTSNDQLGEVLTLLKGITSENAEIRSRLDSVSARQDAADKEKEEQCAKDKAKKDAEDEEQAKKDKAKKDAEDEEAAADKAKKDTDDEKARKDAEAAAEKAKKDAADEKARKDAAARNDNTDLRSQIKDLQTRLVEMPEETRQQFVQSQMLAEPVAQAFGDSAGSPRWLQGETRDQYRRRLITKYQAHSPHWKDVDLAPFNGKALDVVETQVYADAMRVALNPANVAEGTLQMRVTTDETGRKIRSFYGDPEACWGPFKMPGRVVTGWQTKFPH